MSSYLSGSVTPFQKAIISLWFRAPAEALSSLKTFQTLNNGGVLPLLTFGKTSKTYEVITRPTGGGSYDEILYYTPTGHCDWTVLDRIPHNLESTGSENSEGPSRGDTDPSHLGIYKKDNGKYGLTLFLLTANVGDGLGFGLNSSSSVSSFGTGGATGEELDCGTESHWDFGTNSFESRGVAPDNPQVISFTAVDDGGVALGSRGNDFYTALDGITVQPDTWHHLLLSFDVSPRTHAESTSADSTLGDYGDSFSQRPGFLNHPGKIWAALDNVNHTGSSLRQISSEYVEKFIGPNEFASNNAMYAAESGQGGSSKEAGWSITGSWSTSSATGPAIEFTTSASPLLTDPFGIPVASNMTAHMKHVEMAEFQMWTGKTLDTGDASNRKLFIATKKSKTKQGNTLQPVKPDVAAETFGTPDILLHGSRKWIKGVNKGTKGDFGVVGRVEKYKPDPEIGS